MTLSVARRVLIAPSTTAPVPQVNHVVHALHGQTMGTTWSVRVVAANDLSCRRLQADIEAQLHTLIMQLSTWEPASTVSVYNQAPAATWHVWPTACFKVLDTALAIARVTQGAFDPSAGPLVNLWGFGPDGKRDAVPEEAKIIAARQRVEWRKVTLDRALHRVWQPGDVYLDFSGIAKGYAVDHLSEYLQARGFDHHLVDIGGELRGVGCKPDALPWWVELEQPACLKGSEPAHHCSTTIVALHQLAVATSGDYRRYFNFSGKHYSHTVDPRTGSPIDNQVASVTVLHTQCMLADALATALTVMGATDGLVFANQHDIAARFIVRYGEDCQEFSSQAWAALLAS